MHADSGWIQAQIGCHWTRGPYTVSTYSYGPESGYAIYRDRECVARVPDWQGVEGYTDRRRTIRRREDRDAPRT